MKPNFLLLLAATLTVTTASAQTQVGQVTLTPVQPQVQPRSGGVKPRTVTPTSAPVNQTAPKSMSPQTQQVPASWYNLTGQVGGMNTALAKGSQVLLSLEEIGHPGSNLLQVKFGASRLPVNYEIYYNPARLQARKTYGIRAKVFGADGKLIYSSAPTLLPKGNTGTLNLSVQAQ